MVGGFTDHAYVTSSEQHVWACAGRSGGGRMICTGSGSAWLASCLAGAHSIAGIVLSVTGWCHQMANRILRPAGVDVSAAKGYGVTYHVWGKSVTGCLRPTIPGRNSTTARSSRRPQDCMRKEPRSCRDPNREADRRRQYQHNSTG